jgi:hypothetical protein
MSAWSPLQGGYNRPKTDKPILRAHQRALRRQLVVAARPSSRHLYRALAADLLQVRRQSAAR